MTTTEAPPAELAPVDERDSAAKSIISGLIETSCPVCKREFAHAVPGIAAAMRGAHMKKEHPVEYAEEKAAKARKTAGKKGRSKGSRQPPKERKPAVGSGDTSSPPASRRLSGEKWLALATMGLAGKLADGPSPAAGRALAFEAPVFGRAVDKAMAGTILDKWLAQPMLRAEDTAKEYGAAFELPFLMFLAERCQGNDRMLLMIEPMAREALEEIVKQMVPVLKEAKKEEAKLKEGLDLLSENEPELAKQDDRLGYILRQFLGVSDAEQGDDTPPGG